MHQVDNLITVGHVLLILHLFCNGDDIKRKYFLVHTVHDPLDKSDFTEFLELRLKFGHFLKCCFHLDHITLLLLDLKLNILDTLLFHFQQLSLSALVTNNSTVVFKLYSDFVEHEVNEWVAEN